MPSSRVAKMQIRMICGKIERDSKNLSESQLTAYLNELEAEMKIFRETVEDEATPDSMLREFEELSEQVFQTKDTIRRAVDDLKTTDTGTAIAPSSDLSSILMQQTQVLERIASISNESHEIKLPHLNVPKFSGKYSEWLTFRDLFETTVNQNKRLSPVQKLQYLKSLVVDEAAATIRSIPLTDAMFSVAWNQLRSRYEKPFLIIRALISKILNFEFHSKQSITELSNLVRETLDILSTMGDYAMSRDPWILCILLTKLDSKTRRDWSEEYSCEDNPQISEFIDFLENKQRANEIFHAEGTVESKIRNTVNVFTTKALSHSCFCCNETHPIYKCDKFKTMSIQEKEDLVKCRSRCFNCLGTGHGVKFCKSKLNCNKCNKKHNTLLHRETKPDSETREDNIVHCNLNQLQESCQILPTVLVKIVNRLGKEVLVRALLDSGAQGCFISEECLQGLQLKRENSRIPIRCLSGKKEVYSKGDVRLQFTSLYNEKRYSVKAHVMPLLVGNLPGRDIIVKSSATLNRRFHLADPKFNKSQKIDMILGACKFFELLKSDKYYETVDKIYISETELGWVISSGDYSTDCGVQVNSFVAEDEDLSSSLERLWQIEEMLDDTNPLSVEDTNCEVIYKENVKRTDEGRFIVNLPFRGARNTLGDSYNVALKCFLRLEKRMGKEPDFASEYCKFMKGYFELGHMKEATIEDKNSGYYIPHHGIWQRGLDERKFRTVFNASAETSNGTALNDVLHRGPNLLKDLNAILLRFRFGRFAMITDIEKMYRQILIAPDDTKFQKILWRASSREKIRTYELQTVTYGTVCAPYLANRTIIELADRGEREFSLGAKCLRTDIYMDDILTSTNSLEELFQLKRELDGILRTGGFTLKKWATNSAELLNEIPVSELADPTMIDISCETFIKTLGIKWSPNDDCLSVRFPNLDLEKSTKRALLSDLSKIYDPFGWFAPITVSLKLIMQETWLKKVRWDDELTENLSQEWHKIRNEYAKLENVKFPRFLGQGEVEIHGFADASSKAYAAVIYSRIRLQNGATKISLVAARTKLAPIKPLSIPRMELCAAHLLAKLIKKTEPHLNSLNPKYFLWSDSTVVLAWLSSPPRQWKTFVSNRASEILRSLPNVPWSHVGTKDNPADIVSRGARPDELLRNDLWWEGPKWLRNDGPWNIKENDFQTDMEMRLMNAIQLENEVNVIVALTERISSFRRVINVIAYIEKCVNKMRKFETENHLTSEDRQSALNRLIREVQRVAYNDEISRIEKGRMVKRGSSLFKFTPFIDDDGILRVGGRLQNCPYGFNKKHPIILGRCAATQSMIRQLHVDFYHAGNEFLLSMIQRKYYIFGLRRIVKGVIRKCTDCRRFNGETFQPTMAPLPVSRVSENKAFLRTGVDFAGPILLRPWRGAGKITKKGYICIFVCLSTKAIHIELAMSLSADAFIMALKRFLARRGACAEIWSDNGRNFIGAAKILKEQGDEILKLNDKEVRSFLADRMIKWKTIPAYTPHFGGLWEAGIKTVKAHLNRTFKGQVLSVEEYLTALNQIEAIVNTRPLTATSTDPNDLSVLTPGHFLMSGSLCDIPEVTSVPEQLKHGSRLKLIRCLINGYWKRWRNDYLQTINKCKKWQKGTVQPKCGDMVVIKRPNDPPQLWRLGRIHDCYPGTDGQIRVVLVRTQDGLKREASRNLVPIDVEDASSTGEYVEDECS